MLSSDGSFSTVTMACRIGRSPKAVEKHLANLKAAGLLRRTGPDKGGHREANSFLLRDAFSNSAEKIA